MLATIAEDFSEQFGGAVSDEMLFVERRGLFTSTSSLTMRRIESRLPVAASRAPIRSMAIPRAAEAFERGLKRLESLLAES